MCEGDFCTKQSHKTWLTLFQRDYARKKKNNTLFGKELLNTWKILDFGSVRHNSVMKNMFCICKPWLKTLCIAVSVGGSTGFVMLFWEIAPPLTFNTS